MAMLEGCHQLTLKDLNQATCAWLDRDYLRRRHQELATSPLERFRTAKDVGRDSPSSAELKRAFKTQVIRRPRRSDGTVSLAGQRFELPSRYRHLTQVTLRYARWDLAAVELVDADSGQLLTPLYPLDKVANADGVRRRFETPNTAPVNRPSSMAPLLKKMMAEYAATGLPPAYLPTDEETSQ